MSASSGGLASPDFKLLFESAPGCYLVLGPSLDIVAVTQGYLNATMTSREDILGRGIFDVFPDNPDDPAADGVRNLRSSLQRVLNTKMPDTMPVQKYDIRQPNGRFEVRYWSPVNNPVLGSTGELQYIIHRVEDVTEYIQLRQQRNEQNKLSEELRTKAERMEAEVYQRARELEEANRKRLEAIGRLAGGIAHDFNNLLGVILGYAQLLKNAVIAPDARSQALARIEQAAEKAAALVRQLLAYSRQQVLEPEVLDLNAVVSRIEPLIRRVINENIDVQTVLNPALHRVKADPGQLEQVIMNLAINARDAMPDGGKLIIETANVIFEANRLEKHPNVLPGSYVMLSVSDTGVGIEKTLQESIFEPFFTTKGRDKGTGLGLATVHGIVKQSGGQIWVYSEPGMGATFKVYLPRTLEDAKEVSVVEPVIAAEGSETILAVEDQSMLRDLIRTMLDGDGYKTLTAANSEEALKIAAAHSGEIDLLVTDVILPGTNGRSLANQLVESRPTLKVLFISGYTENVIVHHGALDQGTNFLAKPFTHEALSKKVREVLDRPELFGNA